MYMENNMVLELQNVKKSFKKKEVLKGITFSINEGDILAIMGPNGVGKTTLLRTIAGLYDPNEGNIKKAEVSKDENYCSVLFEFNALYPMLTLRENLQFYQNAKKNERKPLSEEAINIVRKLSLENELDKPVRFFSKGMLRKVAVARAILKNPRLLILDEPFDGLDVESHTFLIKYLSGWVKENRKSIIISSHNVADIDRLCNKIVLIRDGRVLKNTTIEELKKEAYSGYSIKFAENENEEKIRECLDDVSIGYEKEENGLYNLNIKRESIPEIITNICSRGLQIYEAKCIAVNLEDIYMKNYEVKNV